MKTDSDHRDDLPEPLDPLPSEGLRTVLSLLLVVHLFILFVAVASNFLPASPIRRQLREVPLVQPYLRGLHMDLAYNYHLTYGNPADFDYRLLIDLDPATGADPIELPPPGLQPRIRRQRYYQLTRSMAGFLEDDVMEGIVPRAVAAGLLAEHGVESGSHRLRLQYNQPPAPPNAGGFFRPGAPGYRTDYDANLIFFQGQLGLVKRADAREVAPVVSEP